MYEIPYADFHSVVGILMNRRGDGSQQTEVSLRRIDKIFHLSQTVDAKGKKLSAELIIEMLETIRP